MLYFSSAKRKELSTQNPIYRKTFFMIEGEFKTFSHD